MASARDAETGPPATVEEAVATATTTSLACYFSKGGSTTWYWGLNDDNSCLQAQRRMEDDAVYPSEEVLHEHNQLGDPHQGGQSQGYNNLAGYELVAIRR